MSIEFLLKLRNKAVAAIIACAPLLSVFPAIAGVEGSVHDFSAKTWSGGEICNVCHTPHNANSNGVQVPLWNHAVSTATYTTYSSPTLKISPVQLEPGNVSRLCLSCHDGTVAINYFGGAVDANDEFMIGGANLGTDLSNDHPVGIYWDHQTQVSGEFNCLACHGIISLGNGQFSLDPKNGKELKFYNHRIECATCHDVHNTEALDVKLLRVTLAGSEICLRCHPK